MAGNIYSKIFGNLAVYIKKSPLLKIVGPVILSDIFSWGTFLDNLTVISHYKKYKYLLKEIANPLKCRVKSGEYNGNPGK